MISDILWGSNKLGLGSKQRINPHDCIGQMSSMQELSSGADFSQFPTYLSSDSAYSCGGPNEENYGGGKEMDE